MDQADVLATRFAPYLALSEDDLEGRRRLAPTEEELDALHDLMVRSPEKSDLYYQVTFTMRADQIFRKEGPALGMTVTQIRQKLAHVETRNYEEHGESINEVESFRFWPLARYFDRIRKQPNGGYIYETEWDYLGPVDLEHKWQILLQPGFDEEALLLAQRYADHEGIKEMAFLPPRGITHRIIFKSGKDKKEFMLPTALRYKPLLEKFAEKYTLEESSAKLPDGPLASSQPHSVEMAEGYLGLWQAVRDYDPQKVESVPGYLKKHLEWHFGDAFDDVSTKADSGMREPGQERILKSRFERLGGEFDAPLGEKDEQEGTTLRDTVEDQKPKDIEGEILFNEIVQAIPDSMDRQVLWESTVLDATQQELAAKLGVSQPAIAKRLKELQKQVRKLLAE